MDEFLMWPFDHLLSGAVSDNVMILGRVSKGDGGDLMSGLQIPLVQIAPEATQQIDDMSKIMGSNS